VVGLAHQRVVVTGLGAVTPVGNTAGRSYRERAHGVHDGWYQGEGGDAPGVTACFCSLGDKGIDTRLGTAASVLCVPYHRDHRHTMCLHLFHQTARVAEPGDEDAYLLFVQDAQELIHARHVLRDQQIDREGTAGQFLCPADLAAQILGRKKAPAEHAEPASVGNGGHDFGQRHVPHAGQDDGMLYTEQFSHCGPDHPESPISP